MLTTKSIRLEQIGIHSFCFTVTSKGYLLAGASRASWFGLLSEYIVLIINEFANFCMTQERYCNGILSKTT